MSDQSQLSYFNSHTPRCTSEFRASPTGQSPTRFDGHGEPLNSYFSLSCAGCGAVNFFVKGYRCTITDGSGRSEFFSDPVMLTCAQCGRTGRLFDHATDGYDAEACAFGGIPTDGVASEFQCPCGAADCMSQVVVRFEYPGDLFDMDIVTDGSCRAENLFSWFSLVGICNECRQWVEITEYECA